jgi:hypothetical protein
VKRSAAAPGLGRRPNRITAGFQASTVGER